MALRHILLALLAATVFDATVQAQPEKHRSAAAAPQGSPAAPRGAAPRGPVDWNRFHHDNSAARVSPHRFGGTNFPVPHAWRGNLRAFDPPHWQSGQWRHVSHDGRLGWWWVIGSSWYFFNTPAYPYPDIYTPPGERFGWWYWCDTAQDYYPYVTFCPVPWESVLPRP